MVLCANLPSFKSRKGFIYPHILQKPNFLTSVSLGLVVRHIKVGKFCNVLLFVAVRNLFIFYSIFP